jgi:hypothetical protein
MISFDAWMTKLDNIVSNAIFVSIYELADMPFRASYEAGDSPEEFAKDELGIGEDGVDWERLNELD